MEGIGRASHVFQIRLVTSCGRHATGVRGVGCKIGRGCCSRGIGRVEAAKSSLVYPNRFGFPEAASKRDCCHRLAV